MLFTHRLSFFRKKGEVAEMQLHQAMAIFQPRWGLGIEREVVALPLRLLPLQVARGLQWVEHHDELEGVAEVHAYPEGQEEWRRQKVAVMVVEADFVEVISPPKVLVVVEFELVGLKSQLMVQEEEALLLEGLKRFPCNPAVGVPEREDLVQQYFLPHFPTVMMVASLLVFANSVLGMKSLAIPVRRGC
jgi:hypothetical protein